VVLHQGEAALARIAQATQPNGTPQLEEVHPVRRPLLSANQNYTPVALSPLRRQNPREEPGALAALAGICAGGRGEILVPTATSDGCGKSPGHADCSPPELHAEGTQSPKGHEALATRVYRCDSDERSTRESGSALRNRSGQLTICAALSRHEG
jgi:hypothetical protein